MRRHRLAEIRLNRHSRIGEGAEHQSAEHLDAQLLQAVLRRVEILRHAALAAHAVTERHALQPARKIVAPGVIHAGQRLGVAALLQAHQRALVRAAVHHRVDRAVFVARHDHRYFADRGEAPVAGVRNFDFQAEEIPDRPAEQPLLLLGVDRGIGEHAKRHTRHAVLRPDEIACEIARHRNVHCLPPRHVLAATVAAAAENGAMCAPPADEPGGRSQRSGEQSMISRRAALTGGVAVATAASLRGARAASTPGVTATRSRSATPCRTAARPRPMA